MNRSESLAHLGSDEVFDILIIGGGATGLGAAVDAASRGHIVALIEQSDFSKGTSSRSTKLVHGGVRYLRQGNVSLVLDALRERGRLARNAPHLVHEMSFVIPCYARLDKPFYAAGMKLYDALAGRLGFAPSRILDRDATVERIPTVRREGLRGGVTYSDGQFDDSRLAIDLAKTAVDHGAALVNYCRCTGILCNGGRVAGAIAVDVETGHEFPIRARAVVNATGVFVDEIRRLADPSSTDMVTVSQGIHLVLPRRFLPGHAALMVPKTADGRVLFAVPWHDRVVVGTTDTERPSAELEPRALDEECSFVLDHACKYLSIAPSGADVLSVFAGLRPLVRRQGGGSTATLSRDHTISVSQAGLVTITGGKWTTYRKMAEDVVDQVERSAGLARRACKTADLHIHGFGRPGPETDGLAIYGSDSVHIREITAKDPTQLARLHPRLEITAAEVRWHARAEMARQVEDVLARRTRALVLDAAASIEAVPQVAAILAHELKRDEGWQARQVAEFIRLAAGYLPKSPGNPSTA